MSADFLWGFLGSVVRRPERSVKRLMSQVNRSLIVEVEDSQGEWVQVARYPWDTFLYLQDYGGPSGSVTWHVLEGRVRFRAEDAPK